MEKSDAMNMNKCENSKKQSNLSQMAKINTVYTFVNCNGFRRLRFVNESV